ncbi:GntR family transcriptional regulator [Leucobacter soli]|uniref:GntR family transcriptional regulator n=1 Tax=Leucobacter soli TaxID=2812850 RepID=UPI003611BEDA
MGRGVLRSRIAAGEILPGSKLPEEELADLLGVSRNTLREGFASLRSEGIVTRVPNRGVFVKQPTEADVREMYRARRIIEPGALLWGTGATGRLSTWVEQGREGIERRDAAEMASANQGFHRAIVARAGSDRLDAEMERILVEMRLIFHGMASDPTFHQPYIGYNAEIVAHLERGDNALAADALIRYLVKAEAQLLESMSGDGRTA